MNIIYTIENNCRDCYKCIRRCPVKAINMIDHHASINQEKCIACGNCVAVCPSGAQQYRNDEKKAIQLLASNKKVFLSIAPAFISEFDIPTDQFLNRLSKLGFDGISETALGAQIVTCHQKGILAKLNTSQFSTACPTFVNTILKHYPNLKENLSPLLSPLLSHCKMLKKEYGEDIAVVFAGPCISKKIEADTHPELLDVALTFDELKNIMQKKRIDSNQNNKQIKFIPCQSNGGAIYPLDGGMIETITNLEPHSVIDTNFFNFSGISSIHNILETENFNSKKIFCEFLACKGGCINGSGISTNKNIITKREKISEYFKTLPKYSENEFINKYDVEISTTYDFCEPAKVNYHTAEDIKKKYLKLGKFKPEDFLDCGGCGYCTCEKFAIACLDKQAETSMCVSSLRKLASSKVKALMKAIPQGLCIVNNDLKIIECNDMFIQLSVSSDIDVTEELINRVSGSNINKFFELSDQIKRLLITKESLNTIIHIEEKILSVNMFIFGDNTTVGIIVQDITKSTVDKKIVITKAKKVIKDNLLTIQKIAFLLGETASETEITLNEIINAYKSKN